MEKHSISLYVANKPGVLNRIALVFSRRGYNIDSLVVSEANNPDFSQMNIVASGEKEKMGQILAQLNKLVDVVHAKDYEGVDVVQCELALMKIKCTTATRTEIMQIAHAFKADIVDISESSITFQMTDASQRLDAARKLFEKYGIIEVVRTGKVLIARGEGMT